MKRWRWAVLLAALSGLFISAAAAETVVKGAGASFPYPCYSQWTYKYYEVTGVKVRYQSIGSSAGMTQIKAGTVDFAGSDVPLEPEKLKEFGLVQFPMLVGGIVPIVNLKGAGSGGLRLTPQVLADIFLKKITRWSDAAIARENPDLNLPDQEITVVHREDGSGTTFIFTNYLSKISPEWKAKVGNDKEVDWPTGIGANQNEGVARKVMQIEGSLGYVEYAYAFQNRIPYALVRNHDGHYIHPSTETFVAAAFKADWRQTPGFFMILTDQPGKFSWPIVGATFILMSKSQANPGQARAALKFLDWAYRHGQEIARKLHYVPLPKNVVRMIEATWTQEIKAFNGAGIWPPAEAAASRQEKVSP
ncbi:MAG: phosphate ABC transporter substrate-binding protein PstS [Deltaproteobacteria bacterium]|nr:MAG: phosphate ABC transporter substrate-binding protein PstS [Deltaproteobacteria bacterium]